MYDYATRSSYLNHIQQERGNRNKHSSSRCDLNVEIYAVETHGIISGSGDEVDCAVNNLDKGIDERFKGLLQGRLDDHVCPQAQTVHELPVIYRMNTRSKNSVYDCLVLLNFRHGGHRITHMDGKLTNVNKRMLVGRNSIHRIEFCDTVAHDNEALVGKVVVLFAILYKSEINHLQINLTPCLPIPSLQAPLGRSSLK